MAPMTHLPPTYHHQPLLYLPQLAVLLAVEPEAQNVRRYVGEDDYLRLSYRRL